MSKKFDQLEKIIKRLRRECPWDKKQTHKTLRRYVIEEAHELTDAIDKRDDEKIKDELGDVLLQVMLHSAISEEKKKFTIDDVIDNLSDKMKRRHPHVFSNGSAKTDKEVLNKWVEIKKKEKKHKSVMDDLPSYLPALIFSSKIQRRASAKKFEWDKIDGVYEKINEEIEEIKNANNLKEREDEIGDLLFTVSHLANRLGIDGEIALRKSTKKFASRFKKMEKLLEKEGKKMEDLNLTEMDTFWNRVKS
ncbi:TPA: nucleoside triphosphate pyrophosphohydrolase [candidate division WOR-3 bacterium]|jgi:tetrapyrrole methylase family protein/MazG family protein|uniref:Nucleoside triphosphate pyrophosphohydrolase n=1 Tax=candidate division WOR-3 bacterium TaxID=2052148 RepID=A0A350HBQ4_UNCW3|nr:nucleoside triphosphate pyrophosphohydrolase [candidate division WOR-3 bacterium]